MLEFENSMLANSRSIAVVGLSPKTSRPSYQVAKYLLSAGYRIFPVNPGQNEILGLTCYPDLETIPEEIDIVDIFRRAEDVAPIVDSAISVGAKMIWMQQGIVQLEAAEKARRAGLLVVMDRCLMVEHRNM